MSWNEVPGEKLFEPVVTMVINFPSFVFVRNHAQVMIIA